MRFPRVLLFLVTFLLTAVPAAVAQTTTGTITGVVADTNGIGLSGVEVIVESPQLLVPRTVTTGDDGEYIVPLLAAGTYTLTFRLGTFRPHSVSLPLAPGQLLPVDVSLGLQVQESVTVVAPAAVVAPRSV